MKILIHKLVMGFVCSLVTSLDAFAQHSDGKITRTVNDPDGAVVSGANASLLHTNRAVLDAGGGVTLRYRYSF